MRLSIALIPTRGLQHSLGLESSESLLANRVMTLPAMYCSHTLWECGVSFFCVCVLAVCVLGVALPFLVPRTPQVLIPLMAALMILGSTMLAIGVMTHNHDPGDQGCRSSLLLLSCPRTVYSTTHALHCSSCACSVLHTFLLLFSNGCTHDPRDHDTRHLR